MEFNIEDMLIIRNALNAEVSLWVSRENYTEALNVATVRDRIQDELDKMRVAPNAV